MRYNFLGLLNRGGFGKIQLLYDNHLRRNVVMKSLLDPTSENCERLIREGRILLELKDQPHIVDLLAYNFDSRNPYLILPFYEDGTLQNFVGKTYWSNAMMMVQNLGAALRSIHSIDGIHRDVKPPNCFIDVIPAGKMVKLGDFGFGRIPAPFTNSEITRHACGTDGYIAPELYRGAEFSPECDIYSLGITGIELITGSRNRQSISDAWFVNNEARALFLQMTSSDPRKRPSADQVVERGREIVERANKDFQSALTTLGLFAAGGLALNALTSD